MTARVVTHDPHSEQTSKTVRVCASHHPSDFGRNDYPAASPHWKETTTMKRHGFRIELTADGVLSHDEAVRALRAALKCLLRSYGLRCTSAEPITPIDTEATAQDAPQSAQRAKRDN